MKTNKEVLKIARKYIGQGGKIFRKFAGLPDGASYCNAYVDYIAYEGEVSTLYFNGAKETYCPHSIEWCRKHLAQTPLYLVLPMDIIYFDWEKNGRPNHIGFVVSKVNTSTVKTIEGNTSMKKGKKTISGVVAEKTRNGEYVQAVFRPHYRPEKINLSIIKVDGSFGYQTVANGQRALKTLGFYKGSIDGILGRQTLKSIQAWAGVSQDAVWGAGTTRAIQKKLSIKQDGSCGPATVKAFQKFVNKVNTKPEPEPEPEPEPVPTPAPVPATNADKIVASAKNLAWAYGTPKSKWAYKGGSPTAKCKTAMKKYGYDTKKKMSDCGNFINTVVRESGVNTHFVAQKAKKKPFPANENFDIVFKGKAVPDSVLKAGDIIRYKKTSGQHTLMYIGDGRLCDAGIYNRFGHIYTNDHRYNKSNVKKSTIQVLRAR